MHRPILVIADRNIDLATMLHHTWTYQALIHDILDMDLNRVRMVDSNGKKKEYDMDQSDQLWKTHKGSPFPIVAEAVNSDLEEVKANEKSIKDLKHSMVSSFHFWLLHFLFFRVSIMNLMKLS